LFVKTLNYSGFYRQQSLIDQIKTVSLAIINDRISHRSLLSAKIPANTAAEEKIYFSSRADNNRPVAYGQEMPTELKTIAI